MKKRIGSYQAVASVLLLLGLFLLTLCSCDLLSSLRNEETDGTEEISSDADTLVSTSEPSATEEVTRIPVTTKDQSTAESEPDSSNKTESEPDSSNTSESEPTPPPAPPVTDNRDTAADAGIGEVMPWNGENGLS